MLYYDVPAFEDYQYESLMDSMLKWHPRETSVFKVNSFGQR